MRHEPFVRTNRRACTWLCLKSLQAEHGAMTPGELEGYVTALMQSVPRTGQSRCLNGCLRYGATKALPPSGACGRRRWPRGSSRTITIGYPKVCFATRSSTCRSTRSTDDSDEPLWEPWISGFERAMRMRPDAWERVVDSGETEAAASVNMILALYDIGQGQSDLAEDAIKEMDSIALDFIPGFVQTAVCLAGIAAVREQRGDRDRWRRGLWVERFTVSRP